MPQIFNSIDCLIMICFYIHLINYQLIVRGQGESTDNYSGDTRGDSQYKGNYSVEPSDKFRGYSNGESRGKACGEHYEDSSNESSDSG